VPREGGAVTITRPVRSPGSLYDTVASRSAGLVIGSYSTSFGLTCRLLAEPVRTHVRHIYALVRIADEIVDDPAWDLPTSAREALLADLERDTLRALLQGGSSNLVVHAFGASAREVGIGPDLVTPFFDTMRTDLFVAEHDAASLERYIYGSAEVVGLMCLRAFLSEERGDAFDRLAPGARRLGAAFQKVNFLRDLADDVALRGRRYFPDIDLTTFSDADRDLLLDDIDADLAAAARAIEGLPDGSRRAVLASHLLFAELVRRLRATPARRIAERRVRVPGPVKAALLVRAVAGGGHR
jgi:phytoene/squalene synthetase